MNKTLLTIALAVAPLTFAAQQDAASAAKPTGPVLTAKKVMKKHHNKHKRYVATLSSTARGNV